jgi:hypothetical protein
MFTKHLVNTAELNGVIKDQKRKPLEREVDKDLAPASKRCVLIFLLFYFLFKTLFKDATDLQHCNVSFTCYCLDVFALLVPSLLTSCQRLVDDLLQCCWTRQSCYKLFQQIVIVLHFNNLPARCCVTTL